MSQNVKYMSHNVKRQEKDRLNTGAGIGQARLFLRRPASLPAAVLVSKSITGSAIRKSIAEGYDYAVERDFPG